MRVLWPNGVASAWKNWSNHLSSRLIKLNKLVNRNSSKRQLKPYRPPEAQALQRSQAPMRYLVSARR